MAATRADLNGIKTELKALFDANNTTTSTVIDLSSGLAGGRRVKQVLTYNPEMIRPQASFFPLVTCFVDQKNWRSEDMAGASLNSVRRAQVTLKIVGSLWNDNLVDIKKDPADDDINYLMENIELILRSSPSLGGKVTWQKATDVKYYTTVLNQQTHLRSGVLTLDCEVFY